MKTMRALRILAGFLAVVIVVVILWVDLATDLWQKYVVMSGLAAGLVTFVLTVFVVDKVIARSAHERWEPVTLLALGDLRRRIAPAGPEGTALQDEHLLSDPDAIAVALERERDSISIAMARWASFLAVSADVADIMDAAADFALELDALDDLVAARRPPSNDPEVAAGLAALERARGSLLEAIDEVLVTHSGYRRSTALRSRRLQTAPKPSIP